MSKPYITAGTEFRAPDGILLAIANRDIRQDEVISPNDFDFVGMPAPLLNDEIDPRLTKAFTDMGLHWYTPASH